MSESRLQTKCLKEARRLGVWARNITTPAYSGMADCMFLYDGRVLFVEFKNPNKKGRLSPLQVVDHERLRAVGHYVLVIDDYSEFTDALETFMQE
tara:strand:+ start:1264 stop:1548 length:285 start_codon:yes stop_codon:yes gene_type:complete